MSALLTADEAARVLHRGGVIAYPTEAVWGLGCDPFDETAVTRLLALKQRAVEKGLILIAASRDQFAGLLAWHELPAERLQAVFATWPGPHTWVAPASGRVPRWITGAYDTVAVRVSAHRAVIALCAAFDGPLVSTSANRAGAAPARLRSQLDPAMLAQLDGIFEGDTGGLAQPTEIRDARSGALVRGG